MKKMMLLIMMATASLSYVLTGIAANSNMSPNHSFKVGVVDVTQILQQSPQIINAKNKLREQFTPRFEKISKDQQNLQALSKKFKKDGITMQASKRKALQQQIVALERQLVSEQQQFQVDFQKERQKYIPVKMLLQNLHTAIGHVAVKDYYTLVIPKNMAAYYQEGPFLKNITSEVQTEFDKIKLLPVSSSSSQSIEQVKSPSDHDHISGMQGAKNNKISS